MILLKRLAILAFLFSSFLYGCKDIYDQELYQKPDWLEGKLYTQLESQENLSLFAECLQLTGYDTLLDRSGSFTIFAPSDIAFNDFLSENQYATVNDIPKAELEKIVKFHIIQDAWTKKQLQALNVDGWIDPLDPKSLPRAYKRQTLLKNPNEKYWIERNKSEYILKVDSTKANDYRMVFTRSRKYVPIFLDAFFDINDLSSRDYEFYFDRPYEPGNIFYAEGKVTQAEIFAENGFIYVLDRVVEPMLNAKELMAKDYPGESYKRFLELIYQFPRLNANLVETYKTPEARSGQVFDTLFNLSFPKLPFDLHEEITGPNVNVQEYTYLKHNGVFIPTDAAFNTFLDEVVTVKSGYPHYADFESIPQEIMQIIVNSHFISNPVYPTDFIDGFDDAEGNTVYIDEGDIIRKEFGSNCTFIGLSKTVAPRAFSCVAGPVYLRPDFSMFMYAIQQARVLPALAREEAQYSFFPVSNDILAMDSSLLFKWIDFDLNRYNFSALDRRTKFMTGMPAGILSKRIMNQVGTSLPNNSANKEFIETLGGNYIIWNNTDNTVQGGLSNTYGYQGDSIVYYHPVQLEEPTDNGSTWKVESWFRYPTTNFYSAISSKYRYFRDYLEKAGLYNPKLYTFPFIVAGESYTVFIPPDTVFQNFGADTLSEEDLKELLLYHFVKGEKIFTDNKMPWSNYETLRVDESSSQYSKNYSNIHIRPGSDVIDILDGNGDLYLSIPESAAKTNIMIAYDTDSQSDDDTDFIITTVVHEIDKILDPKLLK